MSLGRSDATDLRTQYAVANTAKGTIDRGPYDTQEQAEREMEGMYLWKEDRRIAAQRNKDSGFEGGNHDWYYWNQGDLLGGPGIKDYEWRVVKRVASPWEPV
jgi:hypothetical protein